MRVVVTGAAGFLGQHLCRGFAEASDTVVPVVREVRSSSPPGAITMDALLRDPDGSLGGVDAIVHAAAVRHRHGVAVDAYRASNVALVERLATAARGRARRFVLVSSVGVYGFPKALPISEASPYAPATLYAETKVEAETIVRSTLKREDYVIVRPCIVYGRGDDNGMLDKLARMISARRYLVVGDGRNVLHHVYVDDLVAGVRAATRAPDVAGEDFILAGPETITLQRLSELVADAVGARVPRLHVPLPLARATSTVIDELTRRRILFATREPPINHEKLDVMTRPIHFDITKARARLGYAPRVGYAEGIARTLGAGGSAPTKRAPHATRLSADDSAPSHPPS